MPVPGTAPGLLSYLAGRTGLSVDELTRALNIDSGLQGLSGMGNDMRTVVAAAAGGNERARLALEVFVYRLSKAIAGLVVGLQRLDALVFTGGIGENSAVVGDAQAGRDVTRPHARGRCTAEPGHSWPEDPDSPLPFANSF